MSEGVARAERALAAYVALLHDVLQTAAEDAMPQSLWDGADTGEGEGEMPDTLLQRVERETAVERRRVHDVVRHRVAPQLAALRAAIVDLGGGVDPAGHIVDIPVDALDREIAAAAAENAELGRRMVELYDETTALASRMEAEIMETSVPSL